MIAKTEPPLATYPTSFHPPASSPFSRPFELSPDRGDFAYSLHSRLTPPQSHHHVTGALLQIGAASAPKDASISVPAPLSSTKDGTASVSSPFGTITSDPRHYSLSQPAASVTAVAPFASPLHGPSRTGLPSLKSIASFGGLPPLLPLTPGLTTPSSTGSQSSAGLWSPLVTPGASHSVSGLPTVPVCHPPRATSLQRTPSSASHSRSQIHHARLATQPYFHHDDLSGGLTSPHFSRGPQERGVGPAGERERGREDPSIRALMGGVKRPPLSNRNTSAPAFTLTGFRTERHSRDDYHGVASEAAGGSNAAAGGGGIFYGESQYRESQTSSQAMATDMGYFSYGSSSTVPVAPYPSGRTAQGGTLSASSSAHTSPVLNRPNHENCSPILGRRGDHMYSSPRQNVSTTVADVDELYHDLRNALLSGEEGLVKEKSAALQRRISNAFDTHSVDAGHRRPDVVQTTTAKQSVDSTTAMDIDSNRVSKAPRGTKTKRPPTSPVLFNPSLPSSRFDPLPLFNPAPSASNQTIPSSNPQPPLLHHTISEPVVPAQHQFMYRTSAGHTNPITAHSTFATAAANVQTAGLHIPGHAMLASQYADQGISGSSATTSVHRAHQVNQAMSSATAQPATAHMSMGPPTTMPSMAPPLTAVIHSQPPSPGTFRASYDGPMMSGLGVSIPAPLQLTHPVPSGHHGTERDDPRTNSRRSSRGLSDASRRNASEAGRMGESAAPDDSVQYAQVRGHAYSGGGSSQASPSNAGDDMSPVLRPRRDTLPAESRPPSRAMSDNNDMMDETSHAAPSGNGGKAGNASTPSAISPELQAKLDPIFFPWLEALCSNLDATDGKGEPIHQTLMAKKMQRLEESSDFRPFKFRIQAFTNGLYEELIRRGFTETDLPLKKVRQYLWSQTCISRFNEEGKKAKSKGNHVWHVEAKKIAAGHWEFQQFIRKIVGRPSKIAYVGNKWSWTPRVWDPQCAVNNIKANFSSPSLPSWLVWKDNILSGTPGPDAQAVEITAQAGFSHSGKQHQLEYTFFLSVNLVDGIDYARSQDGHCSTFINAANASGASSVRSTPRASPTQTPAATFANIPPLPATGLNLPIALPAMNASLVRTESGNVQIAGSPEMAVLAQEIKHEVMPSAQLLPLLTTTTMVTGISDAVAIVDSVALAGVSEMGHHNAIIEANMQAQSMAAHQAAIHDARVEVIRNNLLSHDAALSANATDIVSQAITSSDPAQRKLAEDVLAPMTNHVSQPDAAAVQVATMTMEPMIVTTNALHDAMMTNAIPNGLTFAATLPNMLNTSGTNELGVDATLMAQAANLTMAQEVVIQREQQQLEQEHHAHQVQAQAQIQAQAEVVAAAAAGIGGHVPMSLEGYGMTSQVVSNSVMMVVNPSQLSRPPSRG